MANKVLSIKMDEKDIEKLNEYYEALAKTGILTKSDISRNAFYKHLLLDHLKDDVMEATEAFNKCSGRILMLSEEDKKDFDFANPYGLSEDSLSILVRCYEEAAEKQKKAFEEAVGFFEEISDREIFFDDGGIPQFLVDPDSAEPPITYWIERMMDSRRKFDESFTRCELGNMLAMIEESSVSIDDKEKLSGELKEKFEKRKNFIRRIYGVQ